MILYNYINKYIYNIYYIIVYCIVFHCIMLYYIVLYYVMLCDVMLFVVHVMWCVMLCYVMWCVMICYVMLCDVLCYVMLCDVLCYVMLCYVMSCYVMSCHVMLCCRGYTSYTKRFLLRIFTTYTSAGQKLHQLEPNLAQRAAGFFRASSPFLQVGLLLGGWLMLVEQMENFGEPYVENLEMAWKKLANFLGADPNLFAFEGDYIYIYIIYILYDI